MSLINSGPSHYYEHFNGVFRPCHQVPAKKGGMRNTNRTDAVRMRLFPSVSNVNGVVAEPGLNNWKLTQAILSAITLPRARERQDSYYQRCIKELGQRANDATAVIDWCYYHQPGNRFNDDEFAAVVVEDMEAQSEKAKQLGTDIHNAISDRLKGGMTGPSVSGLFKLTDPVMDWIKENVVKVNAVEKIVGSLEHGYAGTLDLDCELRDIGPAVVDYKTATVKRNGNGPKPVFYSSWGKQLAAYAVALIGHQKINISPALVSVIIDKGNNGEVFVKVWDNPEELWQQFLHSAAIWRFENNYDPRKEQNDIPTTN